MIGVAETAGKRSRWAQPEAKPGTVPRILGTISAVGTITTGLREKKASRGTTMRAAGPLMAIRNCGGTRSTHEGTSTWPKARTANRNGRRLSNTPGRIVVGELGTSTDRSGTPRHGIRLLCNVGIVLGRSGAGRSAVDTIRMCVEVGSGSVVGSDTKVSVEQAGADITMEPWPLTGNITAEHPWMAYTLGLIICLAMAIPIMAQRSSLLGRFMMKLKRLKNGDGQTYRNKVRRVARRWDRKIRRLKSVVKMQAVLNAVRAAAALSYGVRGRSGGGKSPQRQRSPSNTGLGKEKRSEAKEKKKWGCQEERGAEDRRGLTAAVRAAEGCSQDKKRKKGRRHGSAVRAAYTVRGPRRAEEPSRNIEGGGNWWPMIDGMMEAGARFFFRIATTGGGKGVRKLEGGRHIASGRAAGAVRSPGGREGKGRRKESEDAPEGQCRRDKKRQQNSCGSECGT